MSGADLSEEADGALALRGELDFASVGVLYPRGRDILARRSGEVTLDLSGVTGANSAGLALLLQWLEEARRSGLRLRIRSLPESLDAIARLSNARDLLAAEALD